VKTPALVAAVKNMSVTAAATTADTRAATASTCRCGVDGPIAIGTLPVAEEERRRL
jgi:hypothetical protein